MFLSTLHGPIDRVWDIHAVPISHAERQLLSEADIQRLPSRHWRKAKSGPFPDSPFSGNAPYEADVRLGFVDKGYPEFD